MSDNRNITVLFGRFGSMLTVAFIVLKLCGVINWSWWWVLCPLWGPAALALALMAVAIIMYAIAQAASR